MVSAVILNDLTADSVLGQVLAVSDSIMIGDLLLPDTAGFAFTNFTFPEPALVRSGSFLVYIDVSNVYQGFGGDLGLASTLRDCSDGRNVFIFEPGPRRTLRWFTIDRANLNAELFMRATVDADISSSTRQPLADYGLSVAPNPTSDNLRISFSPNAIGSNSYRAFITDLQGRQLLATAFRQFGTQAQFDLSLADLPAGLYLYHIDGPQGRQSGKVVKR